MVLSRTPTSVVAMVAPSLPVVVRDSVSARVGKRHSEASLRAEESLPVGEILRCALNDTRRGAIVGCALNDTRRGAIVGCALNSTIDIPYTRDSGIYTVAWHCIVR